MFQSLLLLLVTAFADGSSLTADQLVEKHLQAIGGEAWSKVQSMKITGDYESFSSSAPSPSTANGPTSTGSTTA